MTAILGVTGGRFGVNFTFTCPECGEEFFQALNGKLVHPDRKGFCLRERIECQHINKVYEKPVVTVVIQEVKP